MVIVLWPTFHADADFQLHFDAFCRPDLVLRPQRQPKKPSFSQAWKPLSSSSTDARPLAPLLHRLGAVDEAQARLGYDPKKRGRSERCSQRRKQRLAHANAAFNGASSVRFTRTLLSASQAVFTSSERRALVAFRGRISRRVAHELRAHLHAELDQNWQRDFDLTSHPSDAVVGLL